MDPGLQLAGVPIGTTQMHVVLPSQYFGQRPKQEPEQRLMIAVLQEAFECVEKYRFATEVRDRRVFDEARQWFLATESDWPYSFECICAVLDLDANAVRQRLQLESDPQTVPERHAARLRM